MKDKDSLFIELMESLNELPTANNYSAQDRYNDFRQLFMGSDQGKRVYMELLSWGKLFNAGTSTDPFNPHRIGIIEGHRSFVARLMSAVNLEPPHQPEKANKSVRSIK